MTTPARQPQHCDHLTECQSYDEEEYPFCKDRGTPCRFHNRRRCPDYKSVIHDQVECDVRQGTHFAQQMVSDALGEPIYTRATHTSPRAPVSIKMRMPPDLEEFWLREHDAQVAKAEREKVLDEPHIDQYLVRIRKASKALKEEPLRNIISASLLIAAEHYEAMRKNNG